VPGESILNHTFILDELIRGVEGLRFEAPVSHVYNPLTYARKPYEAYLNRYGAPPKEVMLLGMNPGPWGMAQTGVPFGEVSLVREWLAIDEPVGAPKVSHPKRPVTGFGCLRSEVSGKRLWGWAKKRFKTPEKFFSRFFVANYCPLVFMEESGKNKTPDTLRASERAPLFEICDLALRRTVSFLSPRVVLGIGGFARDRATLALTGMPVTIGCLTHPSPANPKANKDWEGIIEKELGDMGIL
jgi:single-strand selective monofunctional uracil DNA glycosylase